MQKKNKKKKAKVNKILQEKLSQLLTTAQFISILKEKQEVQTMNEYIPNGYTNWTEYNRAMARKEKRNYILQGIVGMLVFFGAIALDGITTLYM